MVMKRFEIIEKLYLSKALLKMAGGGECIPHIPPPDPPLKLVFTASLLDVQHLRDSVESKPASLLVVPLGKALDGIPPFWCGRQMAGNS